MKKQIFTLLTLLVLCVTGAWADPTVTTGTYTTRTVSENNLTSSWAFNVVSGSSKDIKTTVTDNEMVLVGTSSATLKMQTSKYASFNKGTEVYIPVPSGSAGSVSVTISSGNDSRWFQLYVNGIKGTEGQRLYSKLNADGISSDGKKAYATKDGKKVTVANYVKNSTNKKANVVLKYSASAKKVFKALQIVGASGSKGTASFTYSFSIGNARFKSVHYKNGYLFFTAFGGQRQAYAKNGVLYVKGDISKSRLVKTLYKDGTIKKASLVKLAK